MKHNIGKLSLISALFLIFASCGQKYFVADGETWGTTYHIVYAGDPALSDSVRAEMTAVNDELSMFNPKSTVSLVNTCATDSVGPRFAEVMTIAREISRISGGVYDPTVGPLVELWGFGHTEFAGTPSDSAVASALSTVGIMDCAVNDEGVVSKKSPETVFDFSSIAKGYGIDCIGRMFERNGVEDYMIEIGGEVLVSGLNPDGRPWHIQIDSPAGGLGHEALEIRALGPARSALASSGNYRNFRTDVEGATFGHIISPLTGRPATTEILSATVSISDCARADALATACMACGNADSALIILKKAGAEGLLVVKNENGVRVVRSYGF